VIGLICLNLSTVEPAGGFLPTTLFPSLTVDKCRVQFVENNSFILTQKFACLKGVISPLAAVRGKMTCHTGRNFPAKDVQSSSQSLNIKERISPSAGNCTPAEKALQ
jgi:hypothetical protein